MNQTQIAIQAQNQVVYNPERIELIKRTVAQGATNDELALFIEQCKRTGLDPVTRQIYFIKDQKGRVQIQTSIDGFRLVAERSGAYEGQTAPQWCGEDGVWREVWLSKTPPAACKIGVWKRGFREALYAVAIFEEYAQRKYSGELSHMWAKMPALMISKVAESLALRKAFANDLSGLYTQEEMAQAEPLEEKPKAIKSAVVIQNPNHVMRHAPTSAPVGVPVQSGASSGDPVEQWSPEPEVRSQAPTPQAPAPQSQETPQWDQPDFLTYRVPFSKAYKGKSLEEIGLDQAMSFAVWLREAAQEAGKPLSADGQKFCQMVEEFARFKGSFAG
jgi:phage recombination protein Bet